MCALCANTCNALSFVCICILIYARRNAHEKLYNFDWSQCPMVGWIMIMHPTAQYIYPCFMHKRDLIRNQQRYDPPATGAVIFCFVPMHALVDDDGSLKWIHCQRMKTIKIMKSIFNKWIYWIWLSLTTEGTHQFHFLSITSFVCMFVCMHVCIVYISLFCFLPHCVEWNHTFRLMSIAISKNIRLREWVTLFRYMYNVHICGLLDCVFVSLDENAKL